MIRLSFFFAGPQWQDQSQGFSYAVKFELPGTYHYEGARNNMGQVIVVEDDAATHISYLQGTCLRNIPIQFCTL